MKAVDVRHELLREKNTQAKRAGMRVESIDAASHPRTPRSARKEGLVDQCAGGMRSDAWHGHPPGNLGDLGGGGNGSE